MVIADSNFQWTLHNLLPSQTGQKDIPSISGLFDKEHSQPQVCPECVFGPVG